MEPRREPRHVQFLAAMAAVQAVPAVWLPTVSIALALGLVALGLFPDQEPALDLPAVAVGLFGAALTLLGLVFLQPYRRRRLIQRRCLRPVARVPDLPARLPPAQGRAPGSSLRLGPGIAAPAAPSSRARSPGNRHHDELGSDQVSRVVSFGRPQTSRSLSAPATAATRSMQAGPSTEAPGYRPRSSLTVG